MLRSIVCTLSLLVVAMTAHSTTSAQEKDKTTPEPPSALSRTIRYNLTQNDQLRQLDAKIDDAARTLRQAKSDTDREAAEESLRTLLSEDYDDRLKGYESELDRLEKTLIETRKKLAKRREAKQDMIKLRIKVLEAESMDLGWPARHRPSLFPRNGASGLTQWRTAPAKTDESKPAGVR